MHFQNEEKPRGYEYPPPQGDGATSPTATENSRVSKLSADALRRVGQHLRKEAAEQGRVPTGRTKR